MYRIKTVFAILRRATWLLTAAFVLLLPVAAFAKDEPPPAESSASFTLGYILVGLCVVLGIAAVVRPTRSFVEDTEN